MSTQPTLFSLDPDDSFPASDDGALPAVTPQTMARASDPATSHQAAAEVTASGVAADQRAKVYALVLAQPGLCSDEIAKAAGLQRHASARRLPELERIGSVRKGPARPSRITGRACVTWFPADAQPVAPKPAGKLSRSIHECNGHRLTVTILDGKRLFECGTMPDLAKKYDGCESAVEALDEFEARATGNQNRGAA